MQNFLFGRQSRAIQKFAVGNRAIREFITPKLGMAVLAAFFNASGQNSWLLPLAGITFLLEAGLAFGESRRQLREGFTVKRSRRSGLIRSGFALVYNLIITGLYLLLPFWVALPLSLVLLLAAFSGFIALSLYLLIGDMRGTPPNEDSALFQQVREMHNLTAVAAQLRLRLLVANTLDERRNLMFYLAWAETYLGHQILPYERWSAAISHYKAALEIDPANLAARVSLLVTYARQGEFELVLTEIKRAVHVFHGKPHKTHLPFEEALWHWHRNEISSEWEQTAGLFQACALVIALLCTSDESGAVKELLEKEITDTALKLPDKSREELIGIIAKKGGTAPGALGVLASGPYRHPADPLELLAKAFCLPLLPIQTIEPAA